MDLLTEAMEEFHMQETTSRSRRVTGSNETNAAAAPLNTSEVDGAAALDLDQEVSELQQLVAEASKLTGETDEGNLKSQVLFMLVKKC